MSDIEPSEMSTKYTICVYVQYQANQSESDSDEKKIDDEDDDDEIDCMNDIVELIFHTYAWATIPEMKGLIEKRTQILSNQQRLFFRGKELKNARTLSSHRIKDGSILWLQTEKPTISSWIVPYGTGYSKKCREMILSTRTGLTHKTPERIEEGEGGSYFMTNESDERIAVFKPRDEETGASNNPKGNCHETLRAGIQPGTGHLREVAAYLLDRTGFYGVPPTVRCEILCNDESPCAVCFHTSNENQTRPMTKIGSLQRFIKSVDVAGNMGPSSFSVREVHKIGILDIRILNNDRNDANILVTQDEFRRYELIPIDHGLSIPETIEISDIDWIWWKWPQAKQPFDPFTKNIIRDIDIDEEMKILRDTLGISERALDNLRIAHMVLKEGMESGLNLYEIAGIILRQKSLTQPSILENLCVQAEKLAEQAVRQARYNARSAAAVYAATTRHSEERESSALRPPVLYAHSPKLSARRPMTMVNNMSHDSRRLSNNNSPQEFKPSPDPWNVSSYRTRTPNFKPLALVSSKSSGSGGSRTNVGPMPSMAMAVPPNLMLASQNGFGSQSVSPPPPIGNGVGSSVPSSEISMTPSGLNRSSTDPPPMKSLSMAGSPLRKKKSKVVELRTERALSGSQSTSSYHGNSSPRSSALGILNGFPPPMLKDDGADHSSTGSGEFLPSFHALPVTRLGTPPSMRDPDELFMGSVMVFMKGDDLNNSPSLAPSSLPIFDESNETDDENDDNDKTEDFSLVGATPGGSLHFRVGEPLPLQKMERSQSCVDLHSNTTLSMWRSTLSGMTEERAMTDDIHDVSPFDAVERFSSWNASGMDLQDGFEEMDASNLRVMIGSPGSGGGGSVSGSIADGIGEIIGRMETETSELKKYFFVKLREALKLFSETHARRSGDPDNGIFDTDTAVGHFVWLNEQRKLLEGRNMLQVRRNLRKESEKKQEELMRKTNPLQNALLYADKGEET